jgi:hypothetical protein
VNNERSLNILTFAGLRLSAVSGQGIFKEYNFWGKVVKAGLHDKRFGHGTPENGHRAKTATSLFTRLHDNILKTHFYDRHRAHRKTAPLLSVYDCIF